MQPERTTDETDSARGDNSTHQNGAGRDTAGRDGGQGAVTVPARSRTDSGRARPDPAGTAGTAGSAPARAAGSAPVPVRAPVPRLVVSPFGDPRRAVPKLLGAATPSPLEALDRLDGPDLAGPGKGAGVAAELVGLRVPDGRHHVHVQGVTGVGKSTWLAHHVLGEAFAGRGVVLIDPQGDLATDVIERLPADCGNRLVILDPDEHLAPPAFNILRPTTPTTADRGSGLGPGSGRGERVVDGVLAVFRRLYAANWGPRMDDVMRAACLTLIGLEDATLADVVPMLTDAQFRRDVLTEVTEPAGLEGFWAAFDDATPTQRAQLIAPVTARLRGVLTRGFARALLAAPRSTFTLDDVLDGGILIARLPKGDLGEDGTRLLGSLLLSALWQAITRRATHAPHRRPDATVVVDECHNFLHLPIGLADALAEARGYRVSLVLAHQDQAQLPPDIRAGIDANARTKVFFTVSPDDARRLARHTAPDVDEYGLSHRPPFQIVARAVDRGHNLPACTLDTLPLPAAPQGRGRAVRHAARSRTGLVPRSDGRAAKSRRGGRRAPVSPEAHSLRAYWEHRADGARDDRGDDG